MLRKKPEQNPGRSVRPQQTANVFSYYANRSSGGEVPDTRRGEPAAQKKRSQVLSGDKLALLPSFIVGLILLICCFYLTSLSTNPKVQLLGNQQAATSLISGTEKYEQEMQKVFAASLQNRSKLLINTEEVASELQAAFPELGEITVVLPLASRRPIVQAQPLPPKLILAASDETFVVDGNGRIMADASSVPSSTREKLPILQDESGIQLERGNYGLSKETVIFVTGTAYQLQSAGIKVQSMILSSVPNEMHARIKDKPYYVKFNLRGESRGQAGTFIATKKKLEAESTTPKQYIDVRVPGKVYYK